MSRRQARKTTTAGSFGESRAQAEKSRLNGGCSQGPQGLQAYRTLHRRPKKSPCRINKLR
jgi:hypothetical protein